LANLIICVFLSEVDKDNNVRVRWEEEGISYAKLESLVNSTRSEYYQYLEGNGIYGSEWSILKLINKVEGGASDYFSKAKDNKGIFDEYIIPSISENLNNQYEENIDALKDIFKSNISITKNLPVLINREADYKNLLTMLTPLIQDAQAGISYGQRKENSIITGNVFTAL
jgi:hypothetical protein